jgi:cell wall-associated NlpC family hydrolase
VIDSAAAHRIFCGAAAISLPVAAVLGLLVLVSGAGPLSTQVIDAGEVAGSVCATSGPIAGLSDDAAQNARTVVTVATGRGGDRAALIAVMTGLTESGLRILGNPGDPSAAGLPVQGVGFDHDSLGIFQQRPGWGSAQQRLDPVASTNLFLDRLLTEPTWSTVDPWRAAQQVQDSAYDGAPRRANHFSTVYGGNYQLNVAAAAGILTVIQTDSTRLNCGAGPGAIPKGPVGAHGLPIGYTIPAGTSPAATRAVLYALAQQGKPYLFGAAGPDSFDCSGLMLAAWAQAGITLAHDTRIQVTEGVPTDAAHLSPGDLVLVPGSDGTLASPGHVGMFLGPGLVVEAPQTGDVVKVVSYSSFTASGVSGLRHID